MKNTLKLNLAIFNALILTTLTIVFISIYYTNALLSFWLTICVLFACLVLGAFCCAFVTDFGDAEFGIGWFAILGSLLCVAGTICTVLVSELFWIMTGIGMAAMVVFLMIEIANSDGNVSRIVSALALTVALPIVVFLFAAYLSDMGEYHIYESGLYQGYSLTEKLKKADDADEMEFGGCSQKGVEYLNIASEFNGKPVTRIYKCSFRSYGKLRGVTIPTSIKIMRKNAFKKCRSLENVIYLGTATEWCTISFDNKFSNPTYYTHELYVLDGLLTDVTLDDGLQKISNYSFYNCDGIKSAYIPATVTEIGAYAFYRCGALDSIVFGGTSDEWRAIDKGENWNVGTLARTVQCSDGAVSV